MRCIFYTLPVLYEEKTLSSGIWSKLVIQFSADI